MTLDEKIRRGHAAKRAIEEFLGPAFETAQAVYSARLEEIASTQPWEAGKITALANAKRVVDEVHRQIASLVHEGEHAANEKIRAERIEKLSASRRRLLNIGAY